MFREDLPARQVTALPRLGEDPGRLPAGTGLFAGMADGTLARRLVQLLARVASRPSRGGKQDEQTRASFCS